MGENKNNYKVCLRHCGQAGSQSYTEQCVPVIPSSNDFTNFYTNEILIIREKKIHHLLPTSAMDILLCRVVFRIDSLDLFCFSELPSTVPSSNHQPVY